MPTIPAPHQESTLAADDVFLAIVCLDEDVVRAEFDAIIAAEWPDPPPDEPAEHDAVIHSPDAGRQRPANGRAPLDDRPRHPGIGGWSRQRSPPPRDHDNAQPKEGDVPT